MEKLRTNISMLLGVIILAACILPGLHSLSHDITYADDSSSIEFLAMDSEADCDLCSFHLTSSDFPEFYTYTLDIPLKQVVFNISLEDKVNLLPIQLFQLRAPPAVIG